MGWLSIPTCDGCGHQWPMIGVGDGGAVRLCVQCNSIFSLHRRLYRLDFEPCANCGFTIPDDPWDITMILDTQRYAPKACQLNCPFCNGLISLPGDVHAIYSGREGQLVGETGVHAVITDDALFIPEISPFHRFIITELPEQPLYRILELAIDSISHTENPWQPCINGRCRYAYDDQLQHNSATPKTTELVWRDMLESITAPSRQEIATMGEQNVGPKADLHGSRNG